ncbi:hypothetical protein MAL08_04715 [Leptospira noguchii]|uniref:hypothetical protein n=1 Tax=Leptospira noguchii TaxID=28182 RepID=UPI001FB7D148|nr:hypothetical protein [Leptospira noguchii]UOG38620.1 hypothetical protein MAL08_04715 [Leptospira noguchii]
MNELKHNVFLNSAKRFLRKRFRSFEVTQRLTSTVVRQVALEIVTKDKISYYVSFIQ